MSSVVLAFGLTVIVDRCLGLFMEGEHDLVFQRYALVNYSTPEFKTKARINNLGFRGEDFDPRKGKRLRIVTLGDSFTFGWGVDLLDAWPSVLEGELRNQGLDVEVANLGRPASYPLEYADIGEKAIPLLKPDLVIVAITQADDLAQTLMEQASPTTESSRRKGWNMIKFAIRSTYPHLVGLKNKLSAKIRGEMNATEGWKEDVAELLSRSTTEEKSKFNRMDDEVKNLFIRGELNPGLLSAGLRHPDAFQKAIEIEEPIVQEGILEVARQLLRIKQTAERFGGRVIVISVPTGLFVSPRMLVSYARMGVIVDQGFLTTKAMDAAVLQAASKAGVGFFEVTSRFREEATRRSLFYHFDGHLNRDGNRFFAKCISPLIHGELSKHTGPNSLSGRTLR